jgi:hypothetical protein
MYGSIVTTSFVTSLDDDEGQWSLYIVYTHIYFRLVSYRHLYNLYSWFCVHYLLIIIKPYDIWFWSYLVVRIHSSNDHIQFFPDILMILSWLRLASQNIVCIMTDFFPELHGMIISKSPICTSWTLATLTVILPKLLSKSTRILSDK